MVRPIVAILLLGAWQLQGAVPPHLHAGMSADELVAHGARRHVHLSHGSHAHHDHAHQHADHDHGHSHSHQGQLACEVARPPIDHDGDALYLTADPLVDGSRTSPQVVRAELMAFAASVSDAISTLERQTLAPPRYGGQVPTFLGITRLLL